MNKQIIESEEFHIAFQLMYDNWKMQQNTIISKRVAWDVFKIKIKNYDRKWKKSYH